MTSVIPSYKITIDPSRLIELQRTGLPPLEEEQDSFSEIVTLTQRIETLTNRIGEHFNELSDRPIKWSTQIHDLGDPEYKLVEPVLILIEEYPNDEIVIARFPELEIFGEGNTGTEALINLKQEILDLYDELTETDPDVLGILPKAWLQILTKIIVKD